MLHEQLTYQIIGCAMEVHKYFGNGFQEKIYHRALALEMTAQGISFASEFEMAIDYKGQYVGTRRVDFFIEEKVMLEIKAVKDLADIHLAQAMNYVEIYKMKIGLLINFGAKSLQHKRVHNNNLP